MKTYIPSRQFLACDVVSTWIWGWNHVATSPNLNTTSHRRRISDVVLTRKNEIITTSYRPHAWNDVEIRLKSRCNCVEIRLKLWRWNKFHLKPFSTSFQRQFAIFQRRFNVETTSLCLLGSLSNGGVLSKMKISLSLITSSILKWFL